MLLQVIWYIQFSHTVCTAIYFAAIITGFVSPNKWISEF